MGDARERSRRTVTEVRVHGVSGTPPRAILRTDPRVIAVRPVPDDEPVPPRPPDALDGRSRWNRPIDVSIHPATDEEQLAVYAAERDVAGRSPAQPDRITAYNWSKLTSGLARHAFWLLLLPYTLMNVAGWMVPDRVRTKDGTAGPIELSYRVARFLDVLVRVGGGVVTSIFAMFGASILVDLVASKCRPGTATCSVLDGFWWTWSPGIWLAVGTFLALAVTVIVGFIVGYDPSRAGQADAACNRLRDAGGRIRPPAAEEPDPVAALGLTDTSLWARRLLTRHLIWVHAGAAAVVLAWVLVAIQMNSPIDGRPALPASFWTTLPATVVVIAGLAAASFTTHGSDGTFRRYAAAAGVFGPLAYVVAAVDATSLSDIGWAKINVEAGLAAVALSVTAALTLIGVVIWVIGLLSRRADTAGTAAMVVLAGLIGGSFGAGTYTLVQRALISGRETDAILRDGATMTIAEAVAPLGGLEWAAVGFLIFLLASLVIAFGIVLLTPLQVSPPLLTEGLRAVTSKVRMLLSLAAFVALAGGVVFVLLELRDLDNVVDSPFVAAETTFNLAVLLLIAAVLVLVVLLVLKFKGWGWAAAVTVGGAVGYGAIATGWFTELKLAGLVVRLDSVRELTVSLALLVPAGFIVSRMVSMVRDREQRRGVGILWDLGSFWQRWYHPFAAPTYGPVAVPDLAAYVREEAQRTDGNERTGVLVSAHSQGTVIAMAALLTIGAPDTAVDPDAVDADGRARAEATGAGRRRAEQDLLDRIAFLSYGSPISHLYERLFPGYFNAGVIAVLQERLNGDAYRWRNLWRQSDPIGSWITGLGDDQQIEDRIADGHSGYENTAAFRRVRSTLINGLD